MISGRLRTALSLVALALLSACAPPEDDGVVTLRMAMWSADSGFKEERAILDAFEEENPGVRVEVIYAPYNYYTEKLLTLGISADPPDIFWIKQSELPYMASRGVAMDLTEMVAQDPEIDVSRLFPNALELCSYEGRLYALPRDVCCNFAYYNKDMFDAAGVDYPTPDWTWEDFREIGLQLAADEDGDGRNDRFALPHYPPEVIYPNGGQFLGDDGSEAFLNSPQVVGAYDWWSSLIHEEGIIPTGQEVEGMGGDFFVNERAAMIFSGPWMLGWYDQQCDFEWDIVNMPAGPEGNRAELLGLPIAISPRSEHKEEAYALLRFLTYSERAQTMQAELGIALPARSDVAEASFATQDFMPDGIQHFLRTMRENTLVANVFPYQASAQRCINSMFDAINLGQMSAQEAGERYQKEIEREIAKAQKRGLL